MVSSQLTTRKPGLKQSFEDDANTKGVTENIEHSGDVEKSSHAVVGSSEDDLVLTQEDIDFVREFDESGRGKKVLRKADWRLVPALVLIYLVRSDRTLLYLPSSYPSCTGSFSR
jgi:hypothetical protein